MKTHMTMILALTLITCNSSGGQGGQPSDKQVIADVNITNKEGLIDAYCVKGKSGEKYWHAGDRTWYWDRGVTIKRKANISGAPDAVVVIRGLARYHTDGANYTYYKFLVSDNLYEGIPAPSKSGLRDFVERNLQKVFISRAHNITEVSSIEHNENTPWVWHNANSFTARFHIAYREIVSYTDVADRTGQFDIRFYRESLDSPFNGLVATEGSRKEIKRTVYTDDEIRQIRTLLNN